MTRISQLRSLESHNTSDAEKNSDSSSSTENWSHQYHSLKNILTHSSSYSAILSSAPSLRNRIQISRRIESLLPKLWTLEQNRRALIALQSTYARFSYTLGLPGDENATDLFICDEEADICVRIEACFFAGPDGTFLSGMRFWYSPSSSKGDLETSRTMGIWLEKGKKQGYFAIETKRKEIISVILCLNTDLGQDNWQGIVGLKVRFQTYSFMKLTRC